MSNMWLVVRRSRGIVGGYRIVQYGLTEEQAKARAAGYKRPHEAMPMARLYEIRTKALVADQKRKEMFVHIAADARRSLCGREVGAMVFEFDDRADCEDCLRALDRKVRNPE